MPINNTFIFVPVRYDYIGRAIDTLYKYTDMSNNRVIVVDQTLNGLRLSMDRVHLVLRPHRNLGFAKANNEGMNIAYRWGSKYITCSNDDVEWINNRWWQGIVDTFEMGENIVVVNPMSPKEPGWGYGLPHGEYIDLINYKSEFSEADYDYLLAGDFSQVSGLPPSFPRQKTGVIDAIATWCPVFNRQAIEKVGFFEERYYPGGGEDYCMDARAYSCKWGSNGIKIKDGCDNEGHEYNGAFRMLGTTRSWVWHWWGSSKDKQEIVGQQGLPIVESLRWMNPDLLWPRDKNLSWNEKEKKMLPTGFDPWGHVTLEDGSKKPMYRIPEVSVVDI